jgi:hypothetical protein
MVPILYPEATRTLTVVSQSASYETKTSDAKLTLKTIVTKDDVTGCESSTARYQRMPPYPFLVQQAMSKNEEMTGMIFQIEYKTRHEQSCI